MTVGIAKPLKTSGGVDKKFNRTYKATFQVIASLAEGSLAVMNAPGIPGFGNAYYWYGEYDLWSFVDGASADPQEQILYDLGSGLEKCIKWQVTVTWSTATSERSQGDPRSNPVSDPPVIAGSFIGETESVFRDVDDAPIANTAGEPYPQPPTVQSNTDGLSISYNTPTINLGLRAQMIGKVNEVAIWGLEKRQAKLASWRWSVAYAGPLAYVKNDFEFHIRRVKNPTTNICTGSDLAGLEGWYTVLPNEGKAPLKVAGVIASKEAKAGDNDVPLNEPVRLSCDGTENTGDMKWNIFKVEREIDFAGIPGMPTTLPGPFS